MNYPGECVHLPWGVFLNTLGVLETLSQVRVSSKAVRKKTKKNMERKRRRGFRATFLFTFSRQPQAKHLLLRRFLDDRGPKLVSKVSGSCEAIQQKSKKHHARAPSRAKSDDSLGKNHGFGIIQRILGIQRIPRRRWQQLPRRPP